ncbi:thiamine pyrophosphate-dependent enzyme [Marinitenerispora sediminis]|uniref:2-oxoisovalerate dehydrogenase subunit alpha n=1 Tax=Marinitenerispora sediminis TaxID=1931232 RepID=A0A368SYF4_9ACTN|nr:thiamine pyrophosphate-dependent enzyme [Marinitenerispora sediminis]RCV47554.1 pyruvate dehydrogenase (acetyl-transferring) E1 component subunit alpha [Marinitenerispora sediminis]RCV47633.1 pyruvate dehydrogenase (acetyl-transferring) E1 component subunit alpha [Marinitenerispora sediminis]RCV49025.1 pyruvate dehydrogenase (acetyl-transferring) E1 component subunit alpha [Marinitenerispora sediminis]
MKRTHSSGTAAVPDLPSLEPIRLVDRHGRRLGDPAFPTPDHDTLLALLRGMVVGRRFDRQAGALARQGSLAVYPSSHGQEACQVAGALALADQDWLFPTYRDSVALLTRGVDPAEVLTLLRGDWHSGYDPRRHRCAPQCTPLASNAPHAVGLTYAARRQGEDTAALVLMGDGATSEGDAHEAYNFAAVWNAPVVFLIQNNRWAISVPVEKQTRAPTLAHKAIGYGMTGYHVDGNDAAAVYAVVSRALAEARSGSGPVLIEAQTYRLDPHTNADAPQRYRDEAEVAYWRDRDPLSRLETLLRAEGAAGDADLERFAAEGERVAADVRRRLAEDDHLDPDDLFAHVYAGIPPALARQRADLRDELREG